MFVFALRHFGRTIVPIDQTDTHKKSADETFSIAYRGSGIPCGNKSSEAHAETA